MGYRAVVRRFVPAVAFRALDRVVEQMPLRLSLRPWRPADPAEWDGSGAWCVLCGWRGPEFLGEQHCESAYCLSCRSIARDRFLRLALVQRVAYSPRMTLLETSPRLGLGYRRAMRRAVRYRASDFDRRAHRTRLALDLQRMSLADASVDVIVSAHVLEHVPDTDAALAEMFRVLTGGGSLLLQVPLLQPLTAPPATPEFHGDDTPVHWRFGLDLTARLRSHGFETTLLVAEQFRARVEQQTAGDGPSATEVDLGGLLRAADPADLTVLADDELSAVSGFRPDYLFAVWHARKP